MFSYSSSDAAILAFCEANLLMLSIVVFAAILAAAMFSSSSVGSITFIGKAFSSSIGSTSKGPLVSFATVAEEIV